MNKIQFIACSSFKYSLDRHCMNNQLSLSLQPSIYFCSTIFNSIQFNWALSYFSILTASCNSFCVVLPYIYLYIFIVLIISILHFFYFSPRHWCNPENIQKGTELQVGKDPLCLRERSIVVNQLLLFFLSLPPLSFDNQYAAPYPIQYFKLQTVYIFFIIYV